MRLVFLISFLFLLSGCTQQKIGTTKSAYINLAPFLHYYDGVQYRLYGNINKAIKNFELALEFDSTNDAACYELAICYSIQNDSETSLKFLEKAININPNNIQYRSLYSNFLINSKNFEKALQNQQQLVILDSTKINSLFQLALLQNELKNYKQSLATLKKIEDQVGHNVRLSEVKLRIFQENNQIDSAFAEVNRITSLDPENPVYLLFKSDLYFRQGQDSIAFRTIANAIELDPDAPQAKIELYHRYLEVGRLKEAIQMLSGLFKKNDIQIEEKSRLFYPLLYEQKVYSLYANELDSLINILKIEESENVNVHDIAYEHFVRMRNLTKAREELNILTFLDENNSDRWEKLISFDFSTQQNELVIVNAKIATKKFKEKSIFYLLQAFAYDELSLIDSSITILTEATKNVFDIKEKSEIFGSLGDMHYKNNDNRKAFKSYDEALVIDPLNARVLNNYSYYLSLINTNLSKALKMSSKAVELDPNNSTYIDTKGWVLFKMERFEEAKEVLRNAIAKSGTNSAVINEHYGDVLFRVGNKDNAYIYWLKAKEIGGGSDKLEEKIKTKTYVP